MLFLEIDHRLVIWTAQTKSMKFSSLHFWSSGVSSPPQSLIRVIGRWTVQMTLQLFALSFLWAAVAQLWGTPVTQERSSVCFMSTQMASMTSFPRMAPVVELVFLPCPEFSGDRTCSSTWCKIRHSCSQVHYAHIQLVVAAYSSSFVQKLSSLFCVIQQ